MVDIRGFFLDGFSSLLFDGFLYLIGFSSLLYWFARERKISSIRNALIEARRQNLLCMVRLKDGLVFGCKVSSVSWFSFVADQVGHAYSFEHRCPGEWLPLPGGTYRFEDVDKFELFSLPSE